MRAAIYVRVSTDHQAQRYSPEHQLEACREYAQSEGLTVQDTLVYNDAGMSGTEMEHRDEVKRLLHDARAGKFEAVLFTAVSRFGRDLADVFAMKKRLESIYGIRIVSIEEGYDSAVDGRNSEMVFTVHAMLAANKSKEMSVAIQRGLRQSAKKGRHIGNVAPYGYTKDAARQLIPNPREAIVVQDIFSMYLDGSGSKTIAERLNERKVPTATGLRTGTETLWQASTINAILHNEVYMGRLIAHRWQTETDYDVSRKADAAVRRQSMRDKDKWVVINGAHEAIIDMATFNQVQDLLAQKARNRGIRRKSNALAGLLRCKECGGSMIITGRGKKSGSRNDYKYVVCAKRRRVGKSACSNQRSVNYGYLLNAILSHLRSLPLSREHRDSFAVSIYKRLQSRQDDSQARLESLETRLQENQEQQMRNLTAFNTGLFSTGVIEQKQRNLVREAQHLQQEMSRLAALEAAASTESKSLEKIRKSLDVFEHCNEFAPLTQQLVMRTLIDRIDFDALGNIDVRFSWQVRADASKSLMS